MRPLLPLVLLSVCVACRQPVENNYPVIDILLHKPAFEQIDSIEKSHKGRAFHQPYPLVLSNDYFPGRNRYKIKQPVFFKRPVSATGPEVRYFFTKDSVLRLIEYRWDDRPEQPIDLTTLFRQYQDQLSSMTGFTGQLKEIAGDQWNGRVMSWKNDSVFVQQTQFNSQDLDYFKIAVSWY